jgi:hypothetical protein
MHFAALREALRRSLKTRNFNTTLYRRDSLFQHHKRRAYFFAPAEIAVLQFQRTLQILRGYSLPFSREVAEIKQSLFKTKAKGVKQ